MSDDPIQAIVDKLDAIEKSVSNLVLKSHAASQASVACDRFAVETAAERGASTSAARIAEKVDRLRRVGDELETIMAPARAAVRAVHELTKWRAAAIIFAVLFALSSAFISGVIATRTGLLFSSEVGCGYLGGNWSPRQDNEGFVCWR
ncbi:MAG: hypothetical protein HQ504_09765 [Rhodospirillaceae bacterium]|nr:hypothetical protein [Rhodospirillaceae bacterium]